MGNIELRKKLGTGVLREYRVFNPNPFQNCEYLGDTEGGLPVHVNREFMSCDLKIGIGCITPHVHVGFGGGGKIVLPGVCGVDTITGFHTSVMARDPQSIGLGRFDGNVMYGEVCEVARMAGLDFKVDALINTRGEVTDLFAGDVVEAHLAGVEVAREHYATPPVAGRDVMVVNSYAKYNEMAISMMMALPGVNFENGTIVLIVDAPEGQVCHYLMRSFGKEYGGECYIRREPLPDTIKVIVCSVYQDRTMTDLFAPADSVTYTSDWGETLAMLEAACPDGGTAAVVPDGTMQYYAAAG